MTADQKLVRIVQALKHAGIDALVMGGHAVRYYGIDRNTIDFDLVTSIVTPQELSVQLSKIPLLSGARKESVWRQRDFARFEIGRLPDGREEWLEFWLRNHLLADFALLKARSETGLYADEEVPFLSLPDLIKSKETERESDWQDISLLEEVQDARLHATLPAKSGSHEQLLANLRSRRGMDRAIEQHLLDNIQTVSAAISLAIHPVSQAFLLPLVSESLRQSIVIRIDPFVRASLETVLFASPKHFALIEICRRMYKRKAMELDRADKQVRLSER